MSNTSRFALASAGAFCLPALLAAQPACVEPAQTSFRTVTVVAPGAGLAENGAGPVQMAIAPDGRIFVAKMATGEIRVWNPANSTLTVAGTIPTWFDTEDGLLGVALAPDFATTHWLYAFFSDPSTSGPNRGCVLARFTIDGTNKLTNRKDILRFVRESSTRHGGGGIAVDGNGVVVIGTGDNTDPFGLGGYAPVNTAASDGDAQRSSSNSNDLRGKILRIKPITFPDNQTPAIGVGTTYDIPAGNLWERINNTTFNPGWDGTDNINLVRKEIFGMGNRNPYHVRVDTYTGWIFWGEVGPDANGDDAVKGPSGHDEWNLARSSGFFGHPYCNGYNRAWGIYNATGGTYPGGFYSCTAPVNNSSRNTGVHHLPSSIPALVAYTSGNSTDDDPRFNAGTNTTTIQHDGETAIGGPMYRYNPALASTVKFPPYYEGKVIFFDWNRRNLRWITLTTAGAIPAGTAGVKNFAPPGFPTVSMIDAQWGPDGALYMLKYSDGGYSTGSGGAIYRVEYTGTYDNTCYVPFGTPVGVRPVMRQRVAPGLAHGTVKLPAGYGSLTLFDASGRKVWSYRRQETRDEAAIRLPARLAQGVFQAKMAP